MGTSKISKHVSYKEATKSRTATKYGIDNTPSDAALARMKHVAENVFEPIREHFGVPIGITSFYRSAALNRAIGGSSTSEHVYGSAMDIDADVYGKITNKQIFDYIKENLNFNQLIWEFGTDKEPAWVHVSLKPDGETNKKQILQAYKMTQRDGKSVTKYRTLV